MPPRPRATHARVSGIRKPKVAGAVRGDPQTPAGTTAITPRVEGGVALDEPTLAVEQVIDEPTPRPRSLAVPLLALALVVLTGLAVVFGIADARLRGTASASNAALVDMPATQAATEQLTDALQTVYSYDYARLDQNERSSREVITPAFAAQFDQLFAQVRDLAPKQQAVVTATVTVSALRSLDGDRAVLVAFLDQQATRAATGGEAAQLAAAGRLTVTGEKIDGRWRIAAVESR